MNGKKDNNREKSRWKGENKTIPLAAEGGVLARPEKLNGGSGGKDLRKSGIGIIGDIPWGSHFSQFYKTKEDLEDILVPFFWAGLQNNEFCIWVTSKFLNKDAAIAAMAKGRPDFPGYLKKGQIEIVACDEWYLEDGKFDHRRVSKKWMEKHDAAIAAGYDGIRVSGNPFRLADKKDWNDFQEYEMEINKTIDSYRLIALCTYPAEKCGANGILDVVNSHQFAIIRRLGRWEMIESLKNKKTENALRKSEQRYRALFSQTTESLALCEIVCDQNGKPCDYRFLDVNPAFERLTGLERGKVIGRLRSKVLPYIDARSVEIYGNTALTGQPASFEKFSRAFGKYFQIHTYRPAPNQFVTLFVDITEHKKAQEALARSEKRFRDVVENTNEFIWEMDVNGVNKYVSPGIEKILGYKPGEVIGKDVYFLWDPAESGKIAEKALEILKTGKPFKGFVNVNRHKDGRKVIVESSGVPLFDKNGKLAGYRGADRDITERTIAEEKLKESEEKYRRIVETAREGIWIADKETKTTYVNERMAEMMGCVPEEMIGRKTSDFMDEEGKAALENLIEQREKGVAGSFEFKFIRKDGSDLWAISNSTPLFDKDGGYAGSFGMLSDITDRKRIENELKISEERARNLIRYAPAGIYEIDFRTGKFTSVNDVMCQMTGYSREELLGMDAPEILDSEGKTLFRQRVKKWLAGEKPEENVEYKIVTKDGREIYAALNVTFTSDEKGNPVGATVISHDVTERRRLESNLRDMAEKYSTLFGSTSDGVWLNDIKGNIIEVNDAYCRMSGYSREEIIGMPVSKLEAAENPKEIADHIKEVIGKGGHDRFETRHRRKDGSIFDVDVAVLYLERKSGRMAIFARDITERKKREAENEMFNRTLKALSDSSQAMIHAENESEYLKDVCRIVVESCGHVMVWIGYAENDERRSVRPVAYAGFEKGYLDTLRITWADAERGRGPTGAAIRTGRIHICKDMKTDSNFALWREEAIKRGYASCVALPLKRGEETFGAVTIYSTESDSFSDSEIRLLADLADDLAYGIISIRTQAGKKLAEEQLRETKDYLENLLNYTNAPIVVWNPGLRITRFNRAFENLTGRKASEVIGKKLDILFPDAGRERSLKYINDTMAGKRWETVEIPILRKDGNIRTVLWNSAMLFGADNKTVTAAIAQGQDITERKFIEEQRNKTLKELAYEKQQTEDLLQRIATEKNLSDIIMENTEAQLAYMDQDFNFLKVNLAYCKGCNRTFSELIGRNHFQIFPNKENEAIFKKVRETGKPVKFTAKPFVYKDQSWRGVTYWDWTLTPAKNSRDEVIGLVFSLIDVTNQVIAKQNLEKYAKNLEVLTNDLKKLQLAVENASDLILITDSDGKILFVNKAVEKLLGFRQSEVLGKKTSMLGRRMSKAFYGRLWRTIKTKKNVFSEEVTNVRKDGGKVVFELNISPVLDKKGSVMFFVCIERDRTEAKEIDRAKTEFISIAAHQLRTPLATISMSAELLLDGIAGPPDKNSKPHLQEIFNTTHKMARLIDLLLNVSRIELGNLEIDPRLADVAAVASEIARDVVSQARAKRIKINKSFAKNLPMVNVDRKILHIALENLLTNAIKYTPEGGKISFEIGKTEKDVVFKVSDTGCGIPRNELSQIFTKMFRASNVSGTNGVGIGLYITKISIVQCGGKIWVETEENRGSTFYISIPLAGMKRKKIKLTS